MSEFSNLLKASRFASLAKPLSRSKGNKNGPTHQIVETRASSLHRQEWGMKYALPSKIKSRYITFNDVDSMERIVDFETNASDHWKRLRFQQMGAPVVLDTPEVKKNPLFHNDVESKTISDRATISDIKNVLGLDSSLKTKQIQALQLAYTRLRPEFLEYVKLKNATLLNEAINTTSSKTKTFSVEDSQFAALALRFIIEYHAKSTKNQPRALLAKSDEFKVKAFGGLSYQLKGRLSNAPNGIQDKAVHPGRILSQDGQSVFIALGGFTSESIGTNYNNEIKNITNTQGKQLREVAMPFQVSGAMMDKSGVVKLKTSPTFYGANKQVAYAKPKGKNNMGLVSKLLTNFR
ncbi:hypothetical protein WICPIJ_004355 [Wickerhamomyces pijperi]|uniref:Uncharacterized protein n=1 Tax=Wickerhamomyces pijperi TaxID=599730 RepID=A0A9P8Q5S4_WICPI|nr:hypothetical protein WICPIJ_004355 [Wickerhamomyces pijperi]